MPLYSSALRRIDVGRRSLAWLAGPSSLSGLYSWFKADAVTGASDGAGVGLWSDQSGRGAHADSTAFPTDWPIYKTGQVNGLPVLRWDGVDDELFASGPPVLPGPAATVLAVIKPVAVAAIRVVLGPFNAAGTPQVHVSAAGKLAVQVGGGAVVGTGATSVSTSAFSVAAWTFTSGANWAVYLNSTTADASGSTAVTLSTPGNGAQLVGRRDANDPFSGDIAEIVVFDRVLTAAERTQMMRTYLGAKYGIAVA